MKVLIALAVLTMISSCAPLFFGGCPSVDANGFIRPTQIPEAILSETQAIAVAKARLASTPEANSFDTARYNVRYSGDTNHYSIDFRKKGAMGDDILPGMWGAGYLVTVDATDGTVTYANGYKR
jgi:hypothetical protein